MVRPCCGSAKSDGGTQCVSLYILWWFAIKGTGSLLTNQMPRTSALMPFYRPRLKHFPGRLPGETITKEDPVSTTVYGPAASEEITREITPTTLSKEMPRSPRRWKNRRQLRGHSSRAGRTSAICMWTWKPSNPTRFTIKQRRPCAADIRNPEAFLPRYEMGVRQERQGKGQDTRSSIGNNHQQDVALGGLRLRRQRQARAGMGDGTPGVKTTKPADRKRRQPLLPTRRWTNPPTHGNCSKTPSSPCSLRTMEIVAVFA